VKGTIFEAIWLLAIQLILDIFVVHQLFRRLGLGLSHGENPANFS